MNTKFLIVFTFLALNLACGSAANTNTSAALNQNTNSPVNIGVLPTPIPEATVEPPVNGNVSNAAPATPSVAPPAKSVPANNQQAKPPVTPANNIPDAETLRRQMQKPSPNSNVSRDTNGGMMMKRSNSNGGSMMKRSSNINQ